MQGKDTEDLTQTEKANRQITSFFLTQANQPSGSQLIEHPFNPHCPFNPEIYPSFTNQTEVEPETQSTETERDRVRRKGGNLSDVLLEGG